MKPPSALLVNNKPFYYPEFTKDLHYELELVVKICKNGRYVQKEFAHKYYEQVALGIDFTARDIQAECKKKGHPWEIAKGFDNSAPISNFISIDRVNRSAIEFELHKNGVDANYSPYTDTGAMAIYFATEKKNLMKSLNLIWKEFDKLQTKPLGKLQLHTAKEQLKGQLAMSDENYSGMMLMMAKSILDLNRISTLDEIFQKIDAVTSEKLQTIAQETLVREEMSILSFIPN